MDQSRKVKPKQVVEVYRKNGINITVHQAEAILDLMYGFSKLAINQIRKS